LLRLPVLIFTLLLSQPLFAQTFYDASKVNDLANKLIEELDHEINEERARLKELSRIIEAAYVNGRPSEARSAEIEANEIMDSINQRRDDCIPTLESDVLSAVNEQCNLESMEDTCGQAQGVAQNDELVNILSGSSSAYNVAEEAAAIQTTKEEAVSLIEKLGQVIDRNNQCSEVIGSTAKAPCINVFEGFIRAYRDGNHKEILKSKCTTTGVGNLKVRFATIMDGAHGPAARIAKAAETHIGNRQQEVQIGKRIMTLKLIIDTVEGRARPMRRPASLGQESGEE
jgi:hypothetical protein